MKHINTHVGKPLATAYVLALMGLLAGMGSDVDGQGTSLDEALTTSSSRARIRALVRVDSVMSLEI
jgi:hypothetical protein